jgi:hypothetical protein
MKKSVNIWNILAVLGFFIFLNFLKNIFKFILLKSTKNQVQSFDNQVVNGDYVVNSDFDDKVIGFHQSENEKKDIESDEKLDME